MAKLLEEIHPGEILLEDFMEPMGISARQLAADIDVSPSRISGLVNGQRPITADTAVRLGMFFGMEPGSGSTCSPTTTFGWRIENCAQSLRRGYGASIWWPPDSPLPTLRATER